MLILRTLSLVSPWIRRAALATVVFAAVGAAYSSRSGVEEDVVTDAALAAVAAPFGPGVGCGMGGPATVPAAVDGSFLNGLWSKTPDAKSDDDIVRFYYFHQTDGIGLYRYGKIGKNTTHSYNWSVVEAALEGEQLRGTLRLNYRKTGAQHDVPFRVGHDGNQVVLTLQQDPQEPLSQATRYVYVPAPLASTVAPDLAQGPPADAHHGCTAGFASDGGVGGRMWIDLRTFATGGTEFALYQFKAAGIDGRGTGWFHVGDFDDWTTEALTFRAAGRTKDDAVLDLTFALSGEKAQTAFEVSGDAPRAMTLTTDPRSFWHVRRYVDAGPSFGSFAADDGNPHSYAAVLKTHPFAASRSPH